MAKSREEIQLAVRQFLGTASVPKVTEKDREDRCLAFLDQVCGPGDEHLIGYLAEIAQGASGRDVLTPNGAKTVYPSATERTNASRLLRVWHRGLAARAVKVEHTGEVKHKWDPSKLSLEQLQALEAAHTAALPAGEVIDALFTETQAPDKTEVSDPIQENDESED